MSTDTSQKIEPPHNPIKLAALFLGVTLVGAIANASMSLAVATGFWHGNGEHSTSVWILYRAADSFGSLGEIAGGIAFFALLFGVGGGRYRRLGWAVVGSSVVAMVMAFFETAFRRLGEMAELPAYAEPGPVEAVVDILTATAQAPANVLLLISLFFGVPLLILFVYAEASCRFRSE